jgi:Flp pilus assembly protein TadG
MRLQHVRKQGKGQEGQAIVEFTLIATLLIVLLLAIAQFGIIWSNYVSVTQAAREGARRAVVKGSEGQAAMVTHADQGARQSAANLNQSTMTVTTTAPNGTWNAGDPITVTVTYPYSVNIIGWAVKSGTLTSSTTMRRE